MARLLSDDRLALRATKGDQRAFAAIYRRYYQDLYRFCLAIIGNPQDAQDALQNTMVKVLGALPGEERHIRLKPWLYRIAHNESVELLRRRRDSQEVDPELAAPGEGVAETAALRERLRSLIADLDRLPERQRAALVMRELAGFKFAEIGEVFGTSAAVVRQTVYEARLSLHQMESGREMNCEKVMWELSAADGRITRRRDIQAHLRACGECRAFRDEIAARSHDMAALAPLPLAAASGLLQGVIGAGHSGAGGSLAGAVGAGAGKAVATSAIVKSAATVAVVAVVGVTAADRGGLIHVGLPGSGSAETRKAPSSGAGGGEAASARSGARLRVRRAPGLAGRPVPAKVRQHQSDARAGVTPSGADGATPMAGAHKAPVHRGTSSHAHGRGHTKTLPPAASHGQQTAASHGGGVGHGSSSGHQTQNSSQGSAGNTHPSAPASHDDAYVPPEATSPSTTPEPTEEPLERVNGHAN